MQSQSSRRIIIFSVILLVIGIIVATIIIILQRSSSSSIDGPSGEEKSSPADREPEQFGVPSNSITFYGTSVLLESGVRVFTVNHFRNSLQNYSSTNDNSIKEVSVYKDSIQRIDSEDHSVLRFKIRINDSYDATVDLKSIAVRDVQITIKDSDGKISISTQKYVEGEVGSDLDYTGDGVPPEEQP